MLHVLGYQLAPLHCHMGRIYKSIDTFYIHIRSFIAVAKLQWFGWLAAQTL